MKKLLSLLQISLVLSLATPFITNARDLTWTGAVSSNWNDSANFSPMFVPTANDTVTIDAAIHHPRLTSNASAYRLVLLGDTLDLNGYSLRVFNETRFEVGVLLNGELGCRGTLASFNNSVVQATVDARCVTLELNESVFSQSCYFEVETGESRGGNEFYEPVSLIHDGSGGESISLALENGDTFHDTLYVSNNSGGNIHLTQTDTSHFKNCVHLASTSDGSIHFGREGGITILEEDGHLVVENGEFTSGQLFIKNIDQQNTTGHRMVLTGTNMTVSDGHSLLSLENCSLNGDVDFTAPNLLLSRSRFEGTAQFTKTGGYDNVSTGDNLFSGDASFTSTSTTGHLLLTGRREDRFLGTVQFTSGSMRVISGYGATAIFEGDVVVNASTVGFYRLKFTGEADQQLSGTVRHRYSEAELDKKSGMVTTAIPVEIDRRLTFTRGYLVTDSVNLVTFLTSANATGATDASFVAGPVKKVGNTAFEFPVGKDAHYRPVGISAPDSVTDAFVGEYFAQGQELGGNKDSSLFLLIDCSYWIVNKATGSSAVSVKLNWSEKFCGVIDTTTLHIAFWNSDIWGDLGHGEVLGNYQKGSMSSSDLIDDFGFFTFSYSNGIVSRPPPEEYPIADGFVENIGQLMGTDSLKHPEILYYGKTANSYLFLGDTCISYVQIKGHEAGLMPFDSNYVFPDSANIYYEVDSIYRYDMHFFGSNSIFEISSTDTSQGYYNYFLGYLDTIYTHANTFQKISYMNIYDGIDLLFLNGGLLKFDIGDSVDPSNIAFYYEGIDSVSVNEMGYLCLYTPYGKQTFQVTASQWTGEFWRVVNVEFEMADTIVSFVMGNRGEGRLMITVSPFNEPPVYVNPQNLIKWSTYYGRGNDNQFFAVSSDDQDNIYITGYTQSVDFPVFSGISMNYNQNLDGAILKFGPGRNRIFSTFYGGSGIDQPRDIEVDNYGNITVVGITSSTNFPPCQLCTTGYSQSSFAGTSDGFIVKLSSNGMTRLMSTWYGGSGIDRIHGVIFDSNNHMIVVGSTSSTNLPVPSGSNAGFTQNFSGDILDGFIAKFDSNNELVWRTYFGGNSNIGEECMSTVVDASNNIFVIGLTYSSTADLQCSPCSTNTTNYFPICGPANSDYTGNSGSGDVFLSCFNSNNYLVWSTQFGGSSGEQPGLGNSIQISPIDNSIIFTGATGSSALDGFPLEHQNNAANAYYDDNFDGVSPNCALDGFIAMFNSSFNLDLSTYYGGGCNDGFNALSIGNNDDFYVVGETNSHDFETYAFQPDSYFDGTFNGDGLPSNYSDGVIVRFNSTYQRTHSTYFGGYESDLFRDVTYQNPVNSNVKDVTMIGFTTSPNSSFPLKDITGSVDYFDPYAITDPLQLDPPLPGPQSFISNLHNVSTPLRLMPSSSPDGKPVDNQCQVSLSPNPARDIVNVRSKNKNLIEIRVYDVYGSKVKQCSGLSSVNFVLDLSELATGIYVLHIEFEDHQVSYNKIVNQ